jgi:hypothetical protein
MFCCEKKVCVVCCKKKIFKRIFLCFVKAVSGNFVENSNTDNNSHHHKCESDIYEQNEIGINQLENGLSHSTHHHHHGMLVSQSFYAKERFKVLLGEFVISNLFTTCFTDIILFYSISNIGV